MVAPQDHIYCRHAQKGIEGVGSKFDACVCNCGVCRGLVHERLEGSGGLTLANEAHLILKVFTQRNVPPGEALMLAVLTYVLPL